MELLLFVVAVVALSSTLFLVQNKHGRERSENNNRESNLFNLPGKKFNYVLYMCRGLCI